MRILRFDDGQIIFKQGDRGDYAYRIVAGDVAILRDGGAEQKLLAKLSKGDVFGEMGLVDDAPRSATAVASTDVRVLALNEAEFIEGLTTHPQDCIHYLRSLFERLRSVNALVKDAGLEEPAEGMPNTAIAADTGALEFEAASDASRRAMGGERMTIKKFPFMVGRRSDRASLDSNDLRLADSEPFQISRSHLAIDRVGNELYVRDRGSYLGCIVNGTRIGGSANQNRVILNRGRNKLTMGTKSSSYVFFVTVP